MRLLRRLLLRLVAWTFRRQPRGRDRARRVLVIKPDHLGDLLLLTPALQRLRAGLPEAHISLLIGPWSAAVLRGNRAVDTVLLCSFPGFTRQPKPGLLQPYMLLMRTAALLRAGHYDVALIARDDHWWGALLALLAGVPRRVGFAAPDVAPLLTDALPYNPAEHVAAQGLALADCLVDLPPSTNLPMHAPIVAEDETWADVWLQAHGVQADTPLVAIHPGAGGQAKLWVAARWGMVADALMETGARVLLTGGLGERELIAEIAAGLGRQPISLAGEATLGQLAAIYKRCRMVLGVDSGPLHLAVATGVPTLTLFGPVDHRRFGPWGPNGRHSVVRSGLWCSPCGAVEGCPRGTSPAECMTTISLSDVLAALEARPSHGAATVYQ